MPVAVAERQALITDVRPTKLQRLRQSDAKAQAQAQAQAPALASARDTDMDIAFQQCLDSKVHIGTSTTTTTLPAQYIASSVIGQLPASAYLLVTDTNVAKLHLSPLQAAFRSTLTSSRRAQLLSYVMPSGEATKTRKTKEDLEDWMLASGLTRDTVIVAIGGGVVGDLVGFVAATFMRSVHLCHVPTTLLAMVDSSIGGKVAVDTPLGKNMIGAFHPAKHIYVFPQFLATLPAREIANGMAEVIKTAAIRDADLFHEIAASASDVWQAFDDMRGNASSAETETDILRRAQLLRRFIASSIHIKSSIVNADAQETTGLRNLVNFGHSIGHALESLLLPEALHGEAIAVGMMLEARIAVAQHHLSISELGALSSCLKAYRLPVQISDFAHHPNASKLCISKLLQRMSIDKKNAGSIKKLVLLNSLGSTLEQRASSVSDADIASAMSSAALVQPPTAPAPPAAVHIVPPGSKSISNRVLLLAALSTSTQGQGCCIRNLLHSDDTRVMIDSLRSLRAADIEIDADGVHVHGHAGLLSAPDKELYVQNAGTAARFLTAACLLAAPTASASSTTLTGNERMQKRPIADLVTALNAAGAGITSKVSGRDGFLPLDIPARGFFPTGADGHIRLSAETSSQYVSAVLMCAPLAAPSLAGQQFVTLELVGDHVISQSYIDLTIALMADFGIHVQRARTISGELQHLYRIPLGAYHAPAEYAVESDASSATYPLALAALQGTECVIPTLGSSSAQGDAAFAMLLRDMGCTVEQTSNATRVRGPPGAPASLRQLGTVDMEPLTDAFLTAAVLFACATTPGVSGQTSTRITGISNQRVKECNRIQAMMDQLARFGVKSMEHEDGLEIFPSSLEQMTTYAAGQIPSIHCYDDHRVAMALSLLGAVSPTGCILEDRHCTAKTWPTWFDNLRDTLGARVGATDDVLVPSHRTAASDQAAQAIHEAPIASRAVATLSVGSTPTIVLIGMRGSGKTHIGRIAAMELGRTLVDADEQFELRYGDLSTFVKQRGWPAFRRAELELLRSLLIEHADNAVLSLGGGIVETPEARTLLQEYGANMGPVVWIRRHLFNLFNFLETAGRPAYGEAAENVFRRREPHFAACSTYEFSNPIDVPNSALPLADQVSNFFGIITQQKPRDVGPLSFAKRTFMLSYNAPSISTHLSDLCDVAAGVDAVELRVDCLSSTSVDNVARELALLRSVIDLPIIYTVRSVAQGGHYPDDDLAGYARLILLALRSGCDYVDVEMRLTEQQLSEICAAKGCSRIIASWHDPRGELAWGHGGEASPMMEKYHLGAKYGDVVKLIGLARTLNDNHALKEFREAVLKPGNKPLLAVNMSPAGQLSRILNPVLNPVTHPKLGQAAPGQLSYAQIQTGLHLLGMNPGKKFHIFGNPVSKSLSPAIHNAVFKQLGTAHAYARCESVQATDEAVLNRLAAKDFGGASVTIPHKVSMMALCHSISPEAEAIGAINTILPRPAPPDAAAGGGGLCLYGDNTDWRAISSAVQGRLSPGSFDALVLGAGGTARGAIYALHRAGAKRILLHNRTRATAQRVVDACPLTWNVLFVETLQEVTQCYAPRVVVSTTPPEGSALPHEEGVAPPGTTVLSADLLKLRDTTERGVAIDMAYTGVRSTLQELVRTSAWADRWTFVSGLDMLLAQAEHQSRLFTARASIPKRAMRNAAEKALHEQRTSPSLRPAAGHIPAFRPELLRPVATQAPGATTGARSDIAAPHYPDFRKMDLRASSSSPAPSALDPVTPFRPELLRPVATQAVGTAASAGPRVDIAAPHYPDFRQVKLQSSSSSPAPSALDPYLELKIASNYLLRTR
ncbi:pentafunctional protein [Ceraceosorus bombacis]|uniref:3-phosphoshikimate 1-carboxyvinyltransferase n=1 Tax=Ceraceosorus bombacis TaxID=401625 RepID=A0A0P1BML1_9BASI|nr:pentafunctional protein [Ceraceosorus bombacis]